MDPNTVGTTGARLVGLDFVSPDGFQDQLERTAGSERAGIVRLSRRPGQRGGAKRSSAECELYHRSFYSVLSPARRSLFLSSHATSAADGARTSAATVS